MQSSERILSTMLVRCPAKGRAAGLFPAATGIAAFSAKAASGATGRSANGSGSAGKSPESARFESAKAPGAAAKRGTLATGTQDAENSRRHKPARLLPSAGEVAFLNVFMALIMFKAAVPVVW
jgi:hypothetical protein